MISVSAFNALLKIMEEPPEHVKFILATTEAHKIPATIVSRCQRFDFRRIRDEDIVARLRFIAENEDIDLTEDAAALIARLADGAMRDALSLLEQCMAFSDHIDMDAVSNAAGIAGRDYLFNILEYSANGDTALAITTVDDLYSKSKDMARLCDELLQQIRNLMLIKTVPGKPELLSCFSNETERLTALADRLSLGEILSKLEILQACAEALPRAVSKRTEFEMAIVKLCSAQKVSGYDAPADTSALERRIASLERELRELRANGVKPAAKSSEPPVYEPEAPMETLPEPEVKPAAKEPESKPERCQRWDDILDRLTEINPGCAGALQGSAAYVQGDRMMIIVSNQFFLHLLKSDNNSLSLQQAALDVTGIKYRIGAKCDKVEETPSDGRSPVDELIEKARQAGVQVDEE